jgi:EAL domain-containing protein (putative c-di-GMP-specific phosphodiesterase class I)
MIVALASALKLRVVAEGIEQESQRAALTAMGCASGQGYLFSRAVLPGEIIGMLAAEGRKQVA